MTSDRKFWVIILFTLGALLHTRFKSRTSADDALISLEMELLKIKELHSRRNGMTYSLSIETENCFFNIDCIV